MCDMVLKGQLLAFQQDENMKKVTANNRKFSHFKYCYNNSLPICHTMYQNLTGVGHTYLNNLIKHFQEFGLEERTHGNTGRPPINMKRVEVSYNVACEMYNFLKNYADIYSLPSPGWNFNKISIPAIFLLTSFSYASVYHDYVEACKDKYGEEVHINCETAFPVTEKYLAHLNRAKQERDYYNANIKRAVEDGKCNPNNTLDKSQILFKTFEGSTYITFDWAQNVQFPYSPQQIGAIFFKSPWKVHLFGVCNTGNFPHTEQTNYVIDEGEMPDDGKLGNCTISLVWHAIKKYNHGEKKLVITYDNCCKSRVNTVDDVVSVINRSTTVHLNTSQCYLNGEGFQYHNFKDYFQSFKKIPNIQKHHHFYFTSQHPGVIFYKDRIEDEYKKATIHTFSFATNILPSTINPKPFSLKRQEELYKEIAPFVKFPFRDITCPKPNEYEAD
ncbi:hypothetical protein C1646_751276 [Rhizophagus diaphanus]|nr:hypothetical protein C1646_751276 [Rhizophagus diaphanus] [Rhizophagus sp. MUCL 43196]